MAKGTPVVSNLYGRARRIALAKKCIYVVLFIIVIVLIGSFLSYLANREEENVDFAYLKEYMQTKGYSCELLEVTGGKCTYSTGVTGYSFIRYDNGFEYVVRTKAYTLTIRHASVNDSKITFRTTTGALPRYKSKDYSCTFKDNVVGGLDKCIEVEEFTELDSDAYLGVIEQAMVDLNEMIDASGYKKDKLLKNNEWIKK